MFQNNPMKRRVQEMLFSQIDHKSSVTGLAGDNPEKYRNMLNKYVSKGYEVLLIDREQENDNVINCCISEARLHLFVDCDFCATIDSCSDTLRAVYNRMRKELSYTKKTKSLAFTFCIRKIGFDGTINKLNKLLYGSSLTVNKMKSKIHLINNGRSYIKYINHNQSIFEKSFILQYKDSSDMLSGIIQWK